MNLECKTFAEPDEDRPFDHGHMEVLKFGDTIVGRGVFQPGWRWSEHVKPIAKTESCQAAHTMFVIQGRMRVVMDDGTELVMKAGDIVRIPPGHDAWVEGDEIFVGLDFSGAEYYARKFAEAATSTQPPAP